MEVVSFDSNGYMQLDGKMSPETYSKLSQGVAGRKGGCFGYQLLTTGVRILLYDIPNVPV